MLACRTKESQLSRRVGTSSPAGAHTPTIEREIPFVAGALGITLLLFGYYVYTWGSFSGFAAAIDTCERPFCDFVRFYFPMGGAIFHTPSPVPGYMYSPFNALLMSGFPPLGITTSNALWGILQASSIILYIVLFRRLVPAGLPVQLLFVALALSSFPILHNLPWGQVGIFTTVAILSTLYLYEERRHLAAAGALAFAVSFKFFPLIFLTPFALRRDTRFVLLALLACGTCLLVLPGVVLGLGDTLRFYGALFESYRNMGWVITNYNSQHFPHVAIRLASAAGHDWSTYLPMLRMISYAIAAANVGLVFHVQKRRLPHADLFSFLILFLTIPFVLSTSWPVDLAFLPFAQGLLLWCVFDKKGVPGSGEATGTGPGDKESPEVAHPAQRAVALLLILTSIAISNVMFFNLVGDRLRYGFLGFVFWADSLLLMATYVELVSPWPRRWIGVPAA